MENKAKQYKKFIAKINSNNFQICTHLNSCTIRSILKEKQNKLLRRRA